MERERTWNRFMPSSFWIILGTVPLFISEELRDYKNET